ncbi:MAG: MFS transporter [Bacteroidetes bacterium]|nr:MFS transporter [Bacteroidota bacterium]
MSTPIAQRSNLMVGLVLLTFFVISFLTNILGPLIPDMISSFDLSVGLAGFLPFSFFVAYGVMSIPAGLLMERYSGKMVILTAFIIAGAGALLFGLFPRFAVALPSLFMIGIGMAMLQVVINPLLRVSGGEERFAFNSVMAQLFFGAASFLSPLLYSYLVLHVHKDTSPSWQIDIFNQLVPANLSWVSLYWIFSLITVAMLTVVWLIPFPKVDLKEDERIEVGSALTSLLYNRYVILFFIGIFCYVGSEQGIANWTSRFLQEYHQVDPATQGASVISYFWGMMTVGCLLGLVLLKLFDSKHVLVFFTSCALISLAAALFGPVDVALIAFPATGFFASVMWSITISLALNSVPSHHGTFAGILCTGIIGGAVVPLIIGGLAEKVGLRYAMMFLFLTLGYVLSMGIWARPLIRNNTVRFSQLFKRKVTTPEA